MKFRPALAAAVRRVSLFDSLESRRMFDATHLVIATQPNDVAAGNSLGTIRVFVVDGDEHIVSADTSNVTLAISDGTGSDGASLAGTTTVTASHGMATFSGLSITTSGTAYTLTATDGDLTTDESDAFNVAAGDVASLAFHTQPDDAEAGATIGADDGVLVYALDKYGNLADGDNGTITMAVSTGPTGETLNGTVAVTADGGVATFDDLSLEKVGDYKVTATQAKLTAASDTFSVSPTDADHLVFVSQPKTATVLTAGTAIVANVLDAYGNLVTTYPTDINLSIASGPLAGSPQHGTNVDGVVTWSTGYAIGVAGTYTLLLDSGSLTPAFSAPITYAPATASRLILKNQPSHNTKPAAGAVLPLSVAVADSYSNTVTTDKSKVTVALDPDNSPDGAKLTGTTTVPVVNGVATFANLSLSTVGSYKLIVTDGELAPATTEDGFTVVAGAPAKLSVQVAPSAVVAGATMTAVKVQVQDKFGNLVTTDTSKVALAVATAPAGATLGAFATARASAGVATFSKIVLNKAGNYGFKLTDGKLPVVTTAAVAVSPAAASKLVIVSGPAAASKMVAGAKVAAIVAQVQDKYGNIVTTDTSTVSAGIVGGGPLMGTTTATAVKGIATFSAASIQQAGDYTLKLTDGSLKSAKTNTFTVTPAAAAKLLLGNSPDDMTAGDTISPMGVFILDAYNNQVTTDASKVTVTLSGATGAKFSSGTTTVTVANGFAGFTDLKTTLAGTDKLVFTDGKLTAATSDTFVVSPDDASKVVFGTVPTTVKAGVALASFVAKVEDQFGNVVTDDTSDVTISPTTAPALAADIDGTTTQTAVAGVATFDDITLATAGAYTFKLADGDLATEGTVPVTVTPGAAAKLEITKAPVDSVAGVAIPMTVQVEDAYGNVVPTDISKITATIVSGTGTTGAVLTGTAAVAAVKGVATFSTVNITTAGEGYKIKFADGLLTADTSDAFDVTPGAAAKLVFGQAPTAATTGAAISPAVTVKVQDKFGNLVADNTSNVTIAVGTTVAGAVLGGTLTVAAEGGIATFDDLTLDKAGSYTLKATDGSLTGMISVVFKLTAAAVTSTKK